jgi:hypothetical protein
MAGKNRKARIKRSNTQNPRFFYEGAGFAYIVERASPSAGVKAGLALLAAHTPLAEVTAEAGRGLRAIRDAAIRPDCAIGLGMPSACHRLRSLGEVQLQKPKNPLKNQGV